ncbi:hypothetical protein DFH08DRAFT_1082372 [Mycena albidolilacea]|uniref:Uncharacterized protein n=1 Tax=Mycena albidolilacea TaxID=1033008 RepID=A0AAD6ZVC2_9AGAR|nr:hypothetical protein DFH08DRAFT_1082372 [Mycena albidolilacea]
MVHLAQELVDTIVDELADSGCSMSVLGACSLTASPFRSSCCRYLFRSMYLSEAVEFERTSDLLTSSPDLGPYFRELEVVLSDSPPANLPLGHILIVLPNIERLVWNAQSITWQDIPAPVTSAFMQMVDLPSLQILHLSNNIRDPVPSSILIRAISSISVRKFVLVVGAIDTNENIHLDVQASPVPISHIVDLQLHGTGAVYPLLLRPSILAHLQLQYLGLSINQMAFKEVFEFLDASSRSLLHLELNGPDWFGERLPRLPLLRFLSLQIFKDPHYLEYLDRLVLDLPRSTPALEIVTLNFRLKHWYEHNSPLDNEPWVALDGVFHDLPQLSEVRCCTLLRKHYRFDVNKFMRKKFPRCRAAEILGFYEINEAEAEEEEEEEEEE